MTSYSPTKNRKKKDQSCQIARTWLPNDSACSSNCQSLEPWFLNADGFINSKASYATMLKPWCVWQQLNTANPQVCLCSAEFGFSFSFKEKWPKNSHERVISNKLELFLNVKLSAVSSAAVHRSRLDKVLCFSSTFVRKDVFFLKKFRVFLKLV